MLDMPLADVIAALSWKPAAIAGVDDRHGRPIAAGEPANLTVFDPDVEWEVVPARLASKSRNTPYVGCGAARSSASTRSSPDDRSCSTDRRFTDECCMH